MVCDRDLVKHFRKTIEAIEASGNVFRIASAIGTLNRDEPKRTWWLNNYGSNTRNSSFFIKHKLDFIYEPTSGVVTINRNPWESPWIVQWMLESADLKQAIVDMKRTNLMIVIFDYLRCQSAAPVADGGPAEIQMGEVVVAIDDLLEAVVAVDSTLFLSEVGADRRNELKTLLRQYRGIFSVVRGESVKFSDGLATMLEEVQSDIVVSAKDSISAFVTVFLRKNFSGTRTCSLANLALFLNSQVQCMVQKVFGTGQCDQNDVRQLFMSNGIFKLVRKGNVHHVTFARVNVRS